jgi:hypothetical protein
MSFTPVGPVQAIIFEEWDGEGPCTPESFMANASLDEGISGRYPIDSTYENTDYELLRGECNPCGGKK